jgi:hypothetical protein
MSNINDYLKRLKDLQGHLYEDGKGEFIDFESLKIFWELVDKTPNIKWIITLTPDNEIYVSAALRGGDA